uniref:Uncharacterized protein n=1 Tax=Strigamia maritima TaxID=126957 RepID=T1JAP4_STRMM
MMEQGKKKDAAACVHLFISPLGGIRGLWAVGFWSLSFVWVLNCWEIESHNFQVESHHFQVESHHFQLESHHFQLESHNFQTIVSLWKKKQYDTYFTLAIYMHNYNTSAYESMLFSRLKDA